MRLHPDDLDVTSFVIDPEQDAVIGTTTVNPNDPTPATWCRICPERTTDCPVE
jgi:hypothetical protein